jgi:hypothetical protein
MKHSIVTSVLLSCAIMVGCRHAGKNTDNLYTQAETIRENSAAVRDLSGEQLNSTENIHKHVQINDNAIREVLSAVPPEGAPQVVERLETALGANAGILAETDKINTAAHDIHSRATDMGRAADSVTHSAGRVEDAPSFWEKLSTSIRRLILIALGLVVIIIGWRFGLDKLVKSVLGVVSSGINTASEWAHSKYVGPAKLIREGKTNEAIAALRAAIPGLDKSFRRNDNAG